jgi:hypothetical protein
MKRSGAKRSSGKCRKLLSKKIRENMREYKSGKLMSNGRRITSRGQCIAISYSQVRKANPMCRRWLSKKK